MNTKLKLFGFAFIALGMLFTSCNKNEKFDDFDLLANHEWSLETVTKGGIDITSDCDLDNTIIFKNSNEFQHEFGSELCSEDFNSENGYSPKKWKLKDGYSILKLKYDIRNGSLRGDAILYWEIIELTDSTLVIKDDGAEENDIVAEVLTYKR